jgi:4-oxalocrotonate tautomerase family enzyme
MRPVFIRRPLAFPRPVFPTTPVAFQVLFGQLWMTLQICNRVLRGKLLGNGRLAPEVELHHGCLEISLNRRLEMPFINIKVLGSLSDEQKSQMISRVSEAVADVVTGEHPTENLLPAVWCVIEEVEYGDWGGGGAVIPEAALKSVIEGSG